MRKKFLGLLTLLLATSLVACGAKGGEDSKSQPAGDSETSQVTPVKRYTVKFMNGDERVATESVKEGETLTAAQIPTLKAPEGKVFVGWSLTEGGEIVDLTTYVVNADVTFYAVLENEKEDGLSVDDKKEAGKTYYLVFGWWEVNDPDDPTKVTSTLTKETVRLFYGNMIKYLKLKTPAATDAEIANIQFRNYSTKTVAEMGTLINADGDVDIMIGVGPNIKTGGNVDYFDRFQTKMGTEPKERYVVAPTVASDLGKETFAWLKDTDAGKDAFLKELTDAEILASFAPVVIDLTVTVHGDTDAVTKLEDKETAIAMPTITVPEGKQFKGFATTQNAEEADLEVGKDASLKYDDLKDLVAEGAKTLDLYPVFKDAPVVAEDLVVYIQLNSGLKEAEAKLLEARYKKAQPEKNMKFEFVAGNAAAFTKAINEASNVDVAIGGGNPVNSHPAHESGPADTAGAKHFASGDRRVCIESTVASGHLALAQDFYSFVKAEAEEFEFHYTYWHKNNTWVTEAERTAIDSGISTHLNTYFAIAEDKTLLDTYNVKVTTYVATGTTVAPLGEETRALREGKGTDLIIGCGNNVDSASGAGMSIVEKKDIPTSIVADGRKVALVHENLLAREIYDNYFKVSE